MSLPRLLAVGGAHVDRRGHITGTYIPGTSNPGALSEEIGGVVFNALRNAVQRGVTGALLSVRGGDAAGEAVARAIVEAGIEDLSAVFLDRRTPSYTALLDGEGELIAGLADMELYEVAFPRQVARAKLREAVASAHAVLCDANMPAVALEKLCAASAGKPIYAIAISPAKAVRLAGLLAQIACLFMNRAEARRLAGAGDTAEPAALAAALRDKGLAAGVITAGSAGATGFDASGIFSIAAPRARRISDVTGAGDALAGATVAALMRGLPLATALREGLAAAMLTVEQASAVATLDKKAFAAALTLVPEPVMVA